MRIVIHAEVTSADGCSVLFEDVHDAIREKFDGLAMQMHDISLGRTVGLRLDIGRILEDTEETQP